MSWPRVGDRVRIIPGSWRHSERDLSNATARVKWVGLIGAVIALEPPLEGTTYAAFTELEAMPDAMPDA